MMKEPIWRKHRVVSPQLGGLATDGQQLCMERGHLVSEKLRTIVKGASAVACMLLRFLSFHSRNKRAGHYWSDKIQLWVKQRESNLTDHTKRSFYLPSPVLVQACCTLSQGVHMLGSTPRRLSSFRRLKPLDPARGLTRRGSRNKSECTMNSGV